jgi:glycine/D-amino acid oxidase-like deaminating enzyme/nitrite reductase/ring-hydroxylating ferredoxin subunit
METKDSVTAGTNISYWTDSLGTPVAFSPLKQNEETEIVIVGGGIAGISVAYCLTRLNKKVILVEDGFIGSGETGRTTAHLVNALDDRYYNLEKLFSEEEARLIAQSHTQAIDFIEKTIAKENIDCDFTRLNGYLFLHPSDKEDSLQKEYEACLRAGIDAEIQNEIPGMQDGKMQTLVFKNQAQFHPLKYLKGLCKAIIDRGGKIFTETHAKKIDETGIETNEGFKISAKHIVVATNSPVNNMFVMHLKQYAYRTYAIGVLVKKGSLPRALWWDTGDFNSNSNVPPYHYVRTQNYNEQYDLLICGGEDHATGLASADVIPEENRYGMLEDWCSRHFTNGEIKYHWSGQVLEPMDSLAYIGRNPLDKDNVYIVTGDSGNGMTHSAIAGILIADLISGKENVWEKIYSPSRFKIFKAGNVFFREVVGGFIAYLKDKPEQTGSSLSEIKSGEGKIIELDGKKYGAYADEKNKLHLVAAECTHLKCIVKWNNDEKSWDCPCHGSRFTYEGKVLNGPANTELFYYNEK